MIRWIVSLAAIFAFAFFLDRVSHPSEEGPLRRIRAEEIRKEKRAAVEKQAAGTSKAFHPPVDDHSRLHVDYAPAEPGNDDAGRALHIRTTRAAPIRAGADGEILAVTHLTSAGLAVDLLDPEGRRWFRYGHLHRLAPGLRQGDRISRGQLIGWAGSSGLPNETRSFLHFAVRSVPKGGEWWKGEAEDAGPIFAAARP